jgi:hypothetical protein
MSAIPSCGGARRALGLLCLLAAGCVGSPAASPPAPPSETNEELGSFTVALTVGSGYRFNTATYELSGNGFQKTGSIDVTSSTQVATVVGGIPFGAGYLLKLTAQDLDRKLTPCTGTATFDVTGAVTVPVPVRLTCHELPATQAVPVPRWAIVPLGGLLLALGLAILGDRRRAANR